MMRPADVRQHLHLLNLSPAEAAELLDVGLRTVRRWTAPDDEGDAEPIPGAAEAALRAWLKLHRLGLSWRPDANSLNHDVQPLMQKQAHDEALKAVLARVKARRGPATLWDVDVERCRATLGKMTVSFYRLRDGGFAPQSFRRSDGLPIDLERDQSLLEDAYACIARKLAAEEHEPRLVLALDEPDFSSVWQGFIELWDMSLSPAVVVTIEPDELVETLGLTRTNDEDLLRFVRVNKMPITHLAEDVFVRGHFTEAKVDSQLAPVFRRVDLRERELRTLVGRLRPMHYRAALDEQAGSTS